MADSLYSPGPYCSSCKHGSCDTPMACERPVYEDDDLSPAAKAIVVALVLAVALLALLCAVMPLV